MKNYIRLISLVFIIAFTLILTSTVVRAGEVSSINVKVKNKSIVVSGTAEASVNAVSISVFNEDGSELVAMKTTYVDDEYKYTKTFELSEGTYIVKVADYTGGNYVVKENVVISEKEENKEENTVYENEIIDVSEKSNEIAKKEATTPKTGDEIMISMILVVGASIGTIILRKNN